MSSWSPETTLRFMFALRLIWAAIDFHIWPMTHTLQQKKTDQSDQSERWATLVSSLLPNTIENTAEKKNNAHLRNGFCAVFCSFWILDCHTFPRVHTIVWVIGEDCGSVSRSPWTGAPDPPEHWLVLSSFHFFFLGKPLDRIEARPLWPSERNRMWTSRHKSLRQRQCTFQKIF